MTARDISLTASGDTADIQKQGANARGWGKSVFENPYAKSDQMPTVTGETLEAWSVKFEAWDAGWKLEDAIRAPQEERAAIAMLLRL